jgi:hypothetical protein
MIAGTYRVEVADDLCKGFDAERCTIGADDSEEFQCLEGNCKRRRDRDRAEIASIDECDHRRQTVSVTRDRGAAMECEQIEDLDIEAVRCVGC